MINAVPISLTYQRTEYFSMSPRTRQVESLLEVKKGKQSQQNSDFPTPKTRTDIKYMLAIVTL
jgi:hypothetical protein